MLGDDQRGAADGSCDDSRDPNVKFMGVHDLRPPASDDETRQDHEDGQGGHERLEPRTSLRAHLDPERPQPVLHRLGHLEGAAQTGIPAPCNNNHIVQQRHRLCLIAAEAAQARTVRPRVPRRKDEDAPSRRLVISG